MLSFYVNSARRVPLSFNPVELKCDLGKIVWGQNPDALICRVGTLSPVKTSFTFCCYIIRARICKRLRRTEPIPPAYVALQVGTTNRVYKSQRQRKCLKDARCDDN
jgi:hypothetical protein